MHRRLLVVVLGVCALLLGGVALRVKLHDASARAYQSHAGVAIGREPTLLLSATLEPRVEVAFEVCSGALRASPTIPEGLAFTVRDFHAREDLVTERLDASLARRVHAAPTFGCVPFASSAALGVGGRMQVLASSTVPTDARFLGRIVVRRPVELLDRGLLVLLAALALAGLGLLVHAPKRSAMELAMEEGGGEDAVETTAPPSLRPPSDALRVLGGAALALAIGFALTRVVPIGGALGGLCRGSILLAAQLAIVVWLVARSSDADARNELGARRTGRFVAFVLAPVLAIVVQIVAQGLLRLIPSTGVSEVEKLVAPSAGVEHVQVILDSFGGLVAFGAVAVLAPIVEELFFRGAVYGALERWRGPNVAAIGTVVAFVLGHAPQLAGARAAALSLIVLALVATGLRRTTGSVLPSAMMHLAHNSLVVAVAFANAR